MRQSVCLSIVMAVLVTGCGTSQPAPLTPIAPMSGYQQAPEAQLPMTASNADGYATYDDVDYDELETGYAADPAETVEPEPTPAPTPTPAPVIEDDEPELPIVEDIQDDEPEEKQTLIAKAKDKVVTTTKKAIGFVKGVFGKG